MMNAEKTVVPIGNTVKVQPSSPWEIWTASNSGMIFRIDWTSCWAARVWTGPQFQRRKRKFIQQWNIYKRCKIDVDSSAKGPKLNLSDVIFKYYEIMCVYIYIYVSIFINLFVAGWNSQCIPHTINLLPLRRHAASRPQSCTKKYVDGQIRRKNCGIYFWLFLKNNNPNVFFTFKGKSMGVLGVMMCFSENFTAQWSAAI